MGTDILAVTLAAILLIECVRGGSQ